MVNEILRACMKNGFLLDSEMLEMFTLLDTKKAYTLVEVLGALQLQERVITRKVFNTNSSEIRRSLLRFSNSDEVDVFFSDFGLPHSPVVKDKDIKTPLKNNKYNVTLVNAPQFKEKKINVMDFVTYFRSRYEFMKKILEDKGFNDLTSIRKLGKNKGNFTIIGAVVRKRITKNKNLMITVEDLTGTVTIIVNKGKRIIFEKCTNLLLDDIVAFVVNGSEDILFCNDIYFPEAFLDSKRKHDDDIWIAFIGDIHCGSSYFLEKNFLRFIKWLNGKEGEDRYRSLAQKVRYLFIVGSIVDGVHNYPGQQNHLSIDSSVSQYSKVADLITLIRDDVQIIMSPGSYDSVWLGEPQPFISKEWAPRLYDIDNLYMVPNPATVEIEGGFKVLMYQGSSINSFIDEMPEMRIKYGHNSPTSIVKEMVRRRHLSPMHGLVDYVPGDVDYLVIDPIPDIILTGDQYKCDISIKNNILLIAASCWQSIVPSMDKSGITPDPCKVPLFNLKTREVKILDFSDDTSTIEWESGEELICKLNELGEGVDG